MKIWVALVNILCKIGPEMYKPYVRFDNNNANNILYVRLLTALYGMLIASLLYYNKYRKDIESTGFEVNPFDACVANIMFNGKQHTVAWHVDDLDSIHMDPKVNGDFQKWLEKTYGSNDIGHVDASHGKLHKYLTMALDYTE